MKDQQAAILVRGSEATVVASDGHCEHAPQAHAQQDTQGQPECSRFACERSEQLQNAIPRLAKAWEEEVVHAWVKHRQTAGLGRN